VYERCTLVYERCTLVGMVGEGGYPGGYGRVEATLVYIP